MNILIVPRISYRFKKQIEYSLERKLIIFLKRIFPNANIEVAITNNLSKKINLLIFSGGNNIILFSKKKEDLLRNKIDNFFFKYALNKKIPIFGICHGAQFLAQKFGCKLNKSKHHVQNHYIEITDNKSEKRKQIVNSYHNIIIIKKSKKVDIFAIADDNSIEAFCHKKLKIGGVIWHPERFNKFRNTDIKIIRKFYATGNFGFRKR